ncbi:MAG: hypothetical protein U5L96_18160 [Owenweeksia sp.]|nr:hypothetical protein [Owenweeksia sp.]
MTLKNLPNLIRLILISVFSIVALTLNSQPCETMSPEILEPIVEYVQEVTPGQTGSPLSTVAYDRVVYWVHGLSGSSSTLSLPAAVSQAGQTSGFLFDARELRSRKPEYDEHNLTVAKVDLHNEIESLGNAYDNDFNVTADRSRHFIIAHSQGGVISRAVAQLIQENLSGYNQEFGGICNFRFISPGSTDIR